MLNNIAIWGGIVGMGVALLALLLMIFAKKDIKDIVNRDVILFDQNFALKKQAIEKSFKLLDDLEQNPAIISNAEFVKLAKQSYNELLCVMTNQMLAEQFKNLSQTAGAINSSALAKFKFDCRKDIGLKTKYIKQTQTVSPMPRPYVSEKPAQTPSSTPTATRTTTTTTRTTIKK